jgi:hypothetical protein
MTRKDREERARAVHERRGMGGSNHGLLDGVDSSLGDVQQAIDPTLTADAYRIIKQFAWRDDGWLRFVPEADECKVHLKWKFTSGRFAGFYCYDVDVTSELVTSLCRLWNKVEGCYSGAFKPTRDRPYDG